MIYTRFVSEPGMGARSPEFCVTTLTRRSSFLFFLFFFLLEGGIEHMERGEREEKGVS